MTWLSTKKTPRNLQKNLEVICKFNKIRTGCGDRDNKMSEQDEDMLKWTDKDWRRRSREGVIRGNRRGQADGKVTAGNPWTWGGRDSKAALQ